MIYINGRFLIQHLTGVQRFALELSKELANLRSDILFLVPSIEEIKHKDILEKINVIEVNGGSGHFWEQYTLPKYLNSLDSPFLINLCNTAPLLYKNKIFTHHDITYIRYPQSYSLKFRIVYKIMAKINFLFSKSVITVSEFSKADISKYYQVEKEKINVIYNAVNSEFSISDQYVATSKPFALAVSSPNYHKNFSSMIKAFLEANIDNLDLKIIGSASGVFNTINLLDKSNSKIKFLGRVSDQELIILYQTANFFIFPSLYEGFGIPPLEAQACGCPVISSNSASLPEVLANSALYFNPTEINSIKNAIIKISSDSSLRESLKKKAELNLNRFSWIRSANKLNSIINDLNSKL